MSVLLAGLFAILLTLLHFLEPQYDPAWRFISEYEVGPFGWVMQAAFLSLSLSLACLLVAVRAQVKTVGGKIGLGCGVVAVLALGTAAFFPIDLVTTPKDQLTSHGDIHGLTAALGNPAFVLASLLIGQSLTKQPAWAPAKTSLLITSGVPLICLLLMFGFLFGTLPADGSFGPQVLIGWPNRLVVGAYALWLITVGVRAIR